MTSLATPYNTDMNNIARQSLIIASFIGFLMTATSITAFPSGSLGAILFAISALGFGSNFGFLLFVQSKE